MNVKQSQRNLRTRSLAVPFPLSFDLLTHSNADSSLRLKKKIELFFRRRRPRRRRRREEKNIVRIVETTAKRQPRKYGVYAHLTHHKSAAFPVIE